MIRRSQGARAFTLMFLMSFSAGLVAFGQAVTGTILGRVTDATGAVVPGAMVQIQNVDTGFSRGEQTDREGRYLSPNLPLGNYSVTVQQGGFQTAERRGISLSVGSEVTVNVELAVGNTQEKVEVTAEAAAVETTNATVSTLVGADQIRDLPLNGRSIDQLALMTPGVIVDQTALQAIGLGMGMHISINGSRMDAVLFLLDGTVTNDASGSGGGQGSVAHDMLGVEAILEYRLLSHNFSAEYGHVSGGVMSQVTRSGTNEFHGSAYEFVRNNVFDARNFFNPGSLPPYRRNQFGGAVGGPIKKDRLFFFANYEMLERRQGTTTNIPVPDLNARRGFLPVPGTGQLQPTTLNPAAVPFVNLYPLPNGPSNGDGTAQYLGTVQNPANEIYAMGRVDYRLSDKDNLFFRYVSNESNTVVPRPTPGFGEGSTGWSNFVVLSETHIFSGSSLNDFRIAFNRTHNNAYEATTIPIPSTVSLAPGFGLGEVRFAVASGGVSQLPSLGSNAADPYGFPQNLFQETETFSTVRGAHSLKFGVDAERIQINAFQNFGFQRGREVMGGLSALLAGTPSNISIVIPGSNNVFTDGFRRTEVGWFVQDDFRVRPNLTLNLGLRQDILTTPTEVQGHIGTLVNLNDPAVTQGPPFTSSHETLSPRVGIAWDPFGDGKTSIRLGAGLYYNPLDGRSYYSASGGGPLFLHQVTITNPPFPNALANGGPSGGGLPAPAVLQNHLGIPTVGNYTIEVQRQLTRTLSLRTAYIGSTGWHLTRAQSANTKLPTIQADGSAFFPTTATSPNPNFGVMNYTTTDGRSNYNGLQATLQKNLSFGLQFQASYTYSKALSDADFAITSSSAATPSTTLVGNDPMRDYGLSIYDQRQTFSLNGTYKLPWDNRLKGSVAKAILGGWAVNGIYTYGSGLPFTLVDGFNNSRDGDTQNPDRPSLNPGFSTNPIGGITAGCPGIPAGQQLGTPARWFDPCAFALSPAGTFGNLGRDTVTEPGTSILNSALMKNTALTERIKLEFRFELYNLFNHPAFAIPNLTVFSSARTYSGSAGAVTSTAIDNREIQLGLKLTF